MKKETTKYNNNNNNNQNKYFKNKINNNNNNKDNNNNKNIINNKNLNNKNNKETKINNVTIMFKKKLASAKGIHNRAKYYHRKSGLSSGLGHCLAALFKKVRRWSLDYYPVYNLVAGPVPTSNICSPEDFELIASTTKNIEKSFIYGLLELWLGEGLFEKYW
ncbi:hypothetical protein NQ318_003076 [Aromia moschata]|uniref:Uncharacterized protein n=1 Tax=Aromia moschata TaxID=1265417 RepID=A0AAV8XPG4_9CUCU|nr:hypothetical protein NQ318_003076 [Aromia moschata]